MDPEIALRQVNELLLDGRTREAQEIAEMALIEADERRKSIRRRWACDTDDVHERAPAIGKMRS